MEFEVGSIVSGKVTKITAFGAFVALDGGKSGMVHISEVSAGFVRDIHDHLSEGQQVRAKIIKIDKNGRISLSLKQVSVEKGHEAPPMEFRKAEQSSDFEDMMNRFKAASDDKLCDQKRRAKRREG